MPFPKTPFGGYRITGIGQDHHIGKRGLRGLDNPIAHWEKVRERPPGLLQHVLTVLVSWSWFLLLPRLPPWSRSLSLCPWASILLYGPLEIAWVCCPQLPHHPCKNGTHSTCFYSTGGHVAENLDTLAFLESRIFPDMASLNFAHFTAYESW